MHVVDSVLEIRKLSRASRARGERVGFVATMGALHEGHASLVRQAREECDRVFVSIFVNPTQFNDPKDLAKYPRTLESDCALLRPLGVDAVFAPSAEEMYPSGYQTRVEAGELATRWEGEGRPGHFSGVATVVSMLLIAVEPDITVFGEKDFQQVRVVERMIQDLKLPVRVVRGTLVRDPDGLAMSSRNARLSGAERAAALAINRGLRRSGEAHAKGLRESRALEAIALEEIAASPLLKPAYLAVVSETTLEPVPVAEGATRVLTAVYAGATRLLDNWKLG